VKRLRKGEDIAYRRLNRLILIALMSSLAVFVFPAGASAGTLDQSQPIGDFGFIAEVGGPDARQDAQTFTAGLSGSLDQVDVAVYSPVPCNGGAGITVEIRTAPGGLPATTPLASANLPAASIPPTTPGGFVAVAFADPAAVTAGTQYALVLSSPACTNIAPYYWSASYGDPYTGGTATSRSSVYPEWSDPTTTDFGFKTYVAVSTIALSTNATPSNAVSLGKAVLNKRKGTATVPVFVPGPGVVTLTGKGVIKQRREKASAGIVSMLVKPAGKTKRKLNATGKAKVGITVTYTPTGGSSSSKSKSLVLKKLLR
jgi:hypothetical protein